MSSRECEGCRVYGFYTEGPQKVCRSMPDGMTKLSHCPCFECLIRPICENRCHTWKLAVRAEWEKSSHARFTNVGFLDMNKTKNRE